MRAAVLKGKDPAQIIEEMEKIDQMGKKKIFFLFLLFIYCLVLFTIIQQCW